MNLTGFAIRDTRPGDGRTIARFVRELVEHEGLADLLRGDAVDFERALFGPSARVLGLIADDIHGEPAAYCIWFYNFSTLLACHGLFIEDVYVVPKARGMGIGRAIFRHLARRAVADGCARMEWPVMDSNVTASAFYRAMGAVAMDEQTTCRLTSAALADLGT